MRTINHPVVEVGRPAVSIVAAKIHIGGKFTPPEITELLKRLDKQGNIRFLPKVLLQYSQAQLGSEVDAQLCAMGAVVICAKLVVGTKDEQDIIIYVSNANQGRPIAPSGDVREQAERVVKQIRRIFPVKA